MVEIQDAFVIETWLLPIQNPQNTDSFSVIVLVWIGQDVSINQSNECTFWLIINYQHPGMETGLNSSEIIRVGNWQP